METGDKTLPQLICIECFSTVHKCFEFIEKCAQNEEILINILSTDEIIISDDKFYKSSSSESLDNIIIDTISSNVKETEVMWNCLQCSKTFKDKKTLQRHSKIHDKKRKAFECTVCSSTFLHVSSLKKHLQSIHDTNRQSKTCKICNKSILTSLKRHMETHDENRKTFQCLRCDQTFLHLSTLKTHLQQIHDAKKVREKCPTCEKTVSNLKNHIKFNHTKHKFQCLQCDRTFAFNATLKQHVQTFHQRDAIRKEDKVLCTLCGKDFKTSSGYKYHMRTHVNDKPFKCRYCDKTFCSSGSRTCHERQHTDERPYSCMYCVKRFRSKNVLLSHTRIHTGERPFVCKICQRAFTQKFALNTHMKIH